MFRKKKEMTMTRARNIMIMSACLVILTFIVGISLGAHHNKLEEKSTIDQFNDTKIKEIKPIEESIINDGTTRVYDNLETLFDTSEYDKDSLAKIELSSDGKLLVSLLTNDEIIANRIEVASNVTKTYLLHVGQSDTCEGNARLIYAYKEKDISNELYAYINVDDLSCGKRLTIHDIEGITNIVNITEEKTVPYQEEPAIYSIYAINRYGRKINISDKLAS